MFEDIALRLRHAAEDLTDRFRYGASASAGAAASDAPARPSRLSLGLVARLALALAVLALVYYPVGMILTHVVDDDLGFDVPAAQVQAGQSRAVAVTAALIGREVDRHPWVSNDPFFLPGAMLDRMPSFQQGIIGALGRFAFEMTDQIGRVRGSSQADGDLQQAAGLLQYSGTVWLFDPSVSLMPTASSEAQYRRARQALVDYNARLAQGAAVFDRRTDNLLATVERFAADLGSSSAQIDHLIRDAGFWSRDATRLLYETKGRAYAYFLLMRALGEDYQVVIRDRQLQSVWDNAVATLAEAARLKPVLVFNAAPSSLILPNHLAAEGFYVLRARTQLREITSVLQK